MTKETRWDILLEVKFYVLHLDHLPNLLKYQAEKWSPKISLEQNRQSPRK